MSDDIVTRLRNHVRGDFEKTSEFVLGLAANEIELLRSELHEQSLSIAELRHAIEDAGPQPKFHYRIMSKHRREWPTLWKAIDKVLTFENEKL